MIHYQLRCEAGHEFDGWFKDSASFEIQAASSLVECPSCGSFQVSRALMALAIPRKGRELIVAAEPPPPVPPSRLTRC